MVRVRLLVEVATAFVLVLWVAMHTESCLAASRHPESFVAVVVSHVNCSLVHLLLDYKS